MKKWLLFVGLVVLSASTQAVDLTLKGVNGDDAKLSDFRGKWVVVNYWATWCPPCIEEMPELQSFHDAHADKDAVVLGLNTELMPAGDIREFLDEYFITYPNFRVGPVSETPLGRVPGLPTSYLVSPEGNVEARQVGAVTRQMIENFIANWQDKRNN
jgi:thiol-disulfide isomerase/thioredoxin